MIIHADIGVTSQGVGGAWAGMQGAAAGRVTAQVLHALSRVFGTPRLSWVAAMRRVWAPIGQRPVAIGWRGVAWAEMYCRSSNTWHLCLTVSTYVTL